MVRLTRKASLIAARAALPSSLEDVKEGAILPGFIASTTPVCMASILCPNLQLEALNHTGTCSIHSCNSQLTHCLCCDPYKSYELFLMQDACFVRFLGHCTGRAGLAQLAGTFVSDPRRAFAVNQSVRAQVVQVWPPLAFSPYCNVCVSPMLTHYKELREPSFVLLI